MRKGRIIIHEYSRLLLMMVALTVWFSLSSRAQDAGFTASLSNSSVSVNEQFRITFELQGSGKNFLAPSFPDFNILSGPNQSTQMQIINGNMSQSISYSYVLLALKEGSFKIGPASIEVNGKKIQSNSLTVIVSKAKAGAQQNASHEGNDTQASLDKKVFLKAIADKTSIYRGEGVEVTYRLYTSVNLVNYSVNKMPSLDGFYSQDIELPQQPQFQRENVNGVIYNVADIKKTILFPQRSGILTVDAMKGEVVARVPVKQQQRSRNPFDAFFNDPFFGQSAQDISLQIGSQPLSITVKELPEGAPASFNGAVGNFSLKADFDKKEVRAHDAVNLKIEISGKGNIKLLDAPSIKCPPDFERYDPKILTNASASSAGVNGNKTFEYLMIPRTMGEYKINVGDFTFFNPSTKNYVTIPGFETVLSVAKGDENNSSTVSGYTKSDLQMLGKDIRFNKVNTPSFVVSKGLFYRSATFYTLVLLPPALLFLLLVSRKKTEELRQNVSLMKSRKANKVAMKRLSAAKKFLAAGKSEEFLDEMFRTLWGFVSDKLQIPVADLSKENVAAILAVKNVKSHTTEQLLQAIDACEIARFAKSKALPNEDIYKIGIEIISLLEEEIV
ncbi:MAG: protein BatD [Crocinitomicaceae bacterium]|nr:protein BatD [Crocinitomicaceae bacterium]